MRMRCSGLTPTPRSLRTLASVLWLSLPATALGCARNAAAPDTVLTIFPPQPTVQVGATIQLRADPARGPLVWSSSAATVATVQHGLVQGLGAGAATISVTDGVDTGSTSITVTAGSVVPSLATDIQPIFGNYCVSCHTPPNTAEGIDLASASAAYANLVNQPSPSTGKTLVVPGDTTNSYLYSMIRGRATNPHDDVPPGCTASGQTPCLPPQLIQLIAEWILAGAKP